LLFLANQQPASALYWLELAAGQGHTDAMHWLGRCHIEGNGLPKNEELGIMWLSKAAAHGHLISRYQMDRLYTLKK
jgi:TPR repeat protein